MVILDANRRTRSVPPLARWSLGVGIIATIGANLAHGIGHGPIGALVSAWPAVALVGSYELSMLVIRPKDATSAEPTLAALADTPAPVSTENVPARPVQTGTLEQAVRARHHAGQSQRAISRELNIDRRKVKRITELPV
jgi:hypothetical protein